MRRGGGVGASVADLADIPLSVLDLAPVGEGSSPAAALRASLDLVQVAERLGYHRYWVAEHHNMPGIASSAPAVLLAHLASVTSTIRVGLGYQPAIWLLGSSDYSARVAGLLGLPFSFAHHFSAGNTLPALDVYRSSFRPSAVLAEPYVMLGVAVLCADTAEHAAYLAKPADLSFLRLRSGRPGRFPTPEEAAAFDPTPQERAAIAAWTQSRVVGDPDAVAADLTALVERTGADELIVTTMAHDPADRVRSYELLRSLCADDRMPVASAHGTAAPAD